MSLWILVKHYILNGCIIYFQSVHGTVGIYVAQLLATSCHTFAHIPVSLMSLRDACKYVASTKEINESNVCIVIISC